MMRAEEVHVETHRTDLEMVDEHEVYPCSNGHIHVRLFRHGEPLSEMILIPTEAYDFIADMLECFKVLERRKQENEPEAESVVAEQQFNGARAITPAR